MPTNSFEQKFLDALRNIFVGAQVEGDSGYINLMRIKSRYFDQGVFPRLMKDIDSACRPFESAFREELFDKLYDFFKAYFSESGSIYFRRTPGHQNVYDKVYTDDRDVILFWKTHMLYYVKTDRLFKNMEITVDEMVFSFNVERMELKRANEKRELIYTFKAIWNGKLMLTVDYSERGRKTSPDEIVRAARANGLNLNEEMLERACRVFEKQAEVDFFINKDAGGFLREQFDLWLFQYVFRGSSDFNEVRLKQLQVIKEMAYQIIDFIAQFEDELVMIWNKPRFVRNSHYVITLDHLLGKAVAAEAPAPFDRLRGRSLWEKVRAHAGMAAQVEEWRELGMIEDGFKLEMLSETDLAGEPLYPQYRHLPLDTKHFADLELEILGLFENLDEALDGWLVHSENYQALNTLLPKFKERVQTIYIDPPFNLNENADYYYNVNYQNSTWLTILQNRLQIAKEFLAQKQSSIFVRVGHDGNMLVRLLLTDVFGQENYRNEIIVRRTEESKGEFIKQFDSMRSMTVNYDNIYWFTVLPDIRFKPITKFISGKRSQAHWHSFWKAEDRPNLRYEILGVDLSEKTNGQWMWSKNRAEKAVNNYIEYLNIYNQTKESLEIYWERTGRCLEFIKRDGSGLGAIKYWIPPREFVISDNNWSDIRGYSNHWEFKTENSEPLLMRIIENITQDRNIVMDYFLGSGTTTAVAHKLGKKWIGIEMGDHFTSVILPRMKKVLAGEQSGISKEVGWTGGGFFKYYELEQYEDTLRRANYDPEAYLLAGMDDPYSSYVFLRDLKLLDGLGLDYTNDRVEVHLEALYSGIDLAETVSCVCGKWIKRITADEVEFEDGTTASLEHPDWSMIKPLVWWAA